MSDNPFREIPNSNPYAPPTSAAPLHTPGNPLLVPAIFLLILASLMVLMIAASLPSQILAMRSIDTTTIEGVGELVGSITSLVLWPLMNAAIVVGAVSMLRLTSYRNACTAAILAVIPVCSPCFLLGIPFGIWALVLLNRPEVKQRFTG